MKKLLFTIFLSALTISSTFAINESKKISLEEAINVALSTNPQIKMTKLDVESAKNNVKIFSHLKNPSFGTFQNMGQAGKGNPQEIGIDYTIEILKRKKRKDYAKSKVTTAFNNQKAQEYNLILEVKKAYIDFLHKKSNLKIVKEQKELSQELLKNAQIEAKKGKIPATDVVQAKIEYNRAIMYFNIAQSELISSQNRFNSVMNSNNIDYDTKEDFLDNNYSKLMTISPNNKNINFEQIKKYTLEHRHDLLAAKQEIKTAQNNLNVVKSQLIPDIEVSGGYLYSTKGMSENNKFQSGAYVGASIVNIPLIYHYQPEIKNAKIAIEKAQLQYQDLEIDVIRNITDAWEKYTIARNTLELYNKELLANSQELLNTSIKSLDKKEINFTSFLVSKKVYLELMLGYYEALDVYYTSYAELLKEMNIPDISSILNEKI